MKNLLFLFLFLSFLILVFFSFFTISQIQGTAMEPTVKSKQVVIFRKSPRGLNLDRADIVIYKPKGQEMDFVGRVIGLPTESVRIENNNVYLDNNVEKVRMAEEYLFPNSKTIVYEEKKWFKIGEFEYFILTDKRESAFSIPRRFVHRNDIKGILFLKL